MMHAALYLLFPLCMLCAAVSDLRSLTIPNGVPVLLVLAFAVLAPLAGMGWLAIAWHLAGAAMAFFVVLLLFAAGVLGGGDAKLIAATSLWMGMEPALAEYFLAFTLVGGAFALVILVIRRWLPWVRSSRRPWLAGLADPNRGMPYGVALAAGGVIAYPSCELAQRLWN